MENSITYVIVSVSPDTILLFIGSIVFTGRIKRALHFNKELVIIRKSSSSFSF